MKAFQWVAPYLLISLAYMDLPDPIAQVSVGIPQGLVNCLYHKVVELVNSRIILWKESFMRQAGSLHEREGIHVSIFPVLSNEGKELVMVYCLFPLLIFTGGQVLDLAQ